MANVMMRVNLKCGGQNHDASVVTTAALQIVSQLDSEQMEDENMLVLGADVIHPSPGCVQYCPSIASVVGSVGYGSMKFLGSMRLQQGKKEIIQNMKDMVVERIRDWAEDRKNKKHLPTQILYYRDGVDEGQYGKVKNGEVPKIRDALKGVAKEFGKSEVAAEQLKNDIQDHRHCCRQTPPHALLCKQEQPS